MTPFVPTRFRDRADAGSRLATRLVQTMMGRDVVVLALPRGGVPVACEIARALDAPLDVVVVRKLGVPYQPELAMGAIAAGGLRVINHQVIDELSVEDGQIEQVAADERRELERRERLYRGERKSISLRGRHVILVDDGIATGSTMRVAVEAARSQGATAVTIAVPVAARETCRALASEGCEVVCLHAPGTFLGISQFYDSFPQLSDAEVRQLLDRSAARSGPPPPGGEHN